MAVIIMGRRKRPAGRSSVFLVFVHLITLVTLGFVAAPPSGAQVGQQRAQQNDARDQNRRGDDDNEDDRRSRSRARNDDTDETAPLSSPLSGGPTQITGQKLNSSVVGGTGLDVTTPLAPAPPGEFERYVERQLGRRLPRYGASLLVPATRDFAVPATTTVPASYRINPGDYLSINATGSVESNIDVQVDNEGKIFLPTVGRVSVAGVRYADIQKVVAAALGIRYRRFEVSVTMARLRGIRVYVSGFANNPGAFTVGGLSTLANAVLAAGGPSAGGSFRSILLYRNGQLVSNFDLYSLLREGDRSSDVILQNEDSIVIPPVGAQVAISGSINEEAIYEAKPGETLGDIIVRYAGGTNALADTSRVMLYRVEYLSTNGSRELSASQVVTTEVKTGDIVQVLSVGSIARPLERQAVMVRVDGEVTNPGDYYVEPNTSVGDIIARAGGLTPRAFIFGTKFQRVSVREQQRESYRDAINQFELALVSTPLTASEFKDAAAVQAQVAAGQAVLARLRSAEPDGRIVLQMKPGMAVLPDNMRLENNDHIYVPPRPTTVGVFGSVYRPGSFQLDPRLKVKDLIDMAGGTARAADKGAIFLVRANGAVIPKKRGALEERVLPGDLVFVPARAQSSSVWAKIRDISTLVFQLGLGAATVAAIR